MRRCPACGRPVPAWSLCACEKAIDIPPDGVHPITGEPYQAQPACIEWQTPHPIRLTARFVTASGAFVDVESFTVDEADPQWRITAVGSAEAAQLEARERAARAMADAAKWLALAANALSGYLATAGDASRCIERALADVRAAHDRLTRP